MRFKHVILETSKYAQMRKFFIGSLGCPIVESEKTFFTVQVGSSLLTWRKSNKRAFYHYALAIADSAFKEMQERISNSVRILPDEEGRTVLASNTWQGKQLYFADPQGNIGEMLSFPSDEQADTWLRIQEIGMPVPDVASFSSKLQAISSSFLSDSSTFRFYGDAQGVLVMVKEQRPWFPTNRPATIHPIKVKLDGCQREITLNEHLPYVIIA